MSESSKFQVYVFEHQLPHPISGPYRCAQVANGNCERLVYYIGVVDGLLRYIGAILMSDFFSKGPSPQKADRVVKTLLQPTMNKWADLAIALAGELYQRSPFVPELIQALVQRNKKPAASGVELKRLAARCFELLLSQAALVNEEEAVRQSETLGAEIDALLSGFSFLKKYPLVMFRSHQGYTGDGFRGLMLPWMGYRSQPLSISVEFDSPVPVDSPLIISPETHRALELAPFVKVEQAANKEGEALYLVAGLRDEATLRMECFSAGRFQVHKLNGGDEPVGLTEYMGSWGEGGKVTSLTPSKNTANWLKYRSRLFPSEKVLGGRYKVLGFVGRGGIGAVYRVWDLEAGEQKAIKILYPDLSRNEFFTRYFLETGGMLARLRHDNLVRVYEAGYSSTLQENYIVMAHMGGGSLQELLQRRESLPPQEALRIALAILQAVEYLHNSGLVHGGIHPGNVLFATDGTPCLSDFGVLRLPSSRVTTFRPLERLHSLRYASPELLLDGQASKQSDLYSAGLVLFEMLTGQVPSKTKFVPPSKLTFLIPEGLDLVMEKALQNVAGNRYASAEEFAEALREVMSSMGPEYVVSPTIMVQQLAGHVLDIHSGHTEALDLEREEKMASGDYKAVAQLLHVKLDKIWDIDEKVYWMQRLAELYFEKLDMPGKAVSLYRGCLELSPDNPVAAETLIAHFEKTGEWDELAQLLEELSEQAGSDERQTYYLRRLVDVYREKLDDPASASSTLEVLVEKTGADPEWLELLVNLKEQLQDWAGAAKALEKWYQLATAAQEKLNILRRLAAIYHVELNDAQAAIATYQKILELAETDRTALDGLRTLYRRVFAYPALTALLRRMINSGVYTKSELVELYQELGEILSSYIYDSSEATAVWHQLLDLDPGNYTALSYLERLYLREGMNDKYLEILERKAAVCQQPNEKAVILLSAALARQEFFGDISGSRKLLEEGLALSPGHRGIEAALERLYAEHNDVEALARLLLSRLEREEQSVRRMEILWKLAALFEKELNDPVAAFEVLKKGFIEAPKDPAVRNELERLAALGATVEDLVAFYMECLPRAEPDDKDYIVGRVAQHCLLGLEDDDKALYALERAAELVPGNESLQRGLMSLYREQEKWDKLASTMLEHLKSAEPARKGELVDELALLVKNRLSGSSYGQQVLLDLVKESESLYGKHDMSALKDAARELGQWLSLTDIVKRELETVEDPVRAQTLRRELAAAFMAVKDYQNALIWLESALDKSPQDVGLQKAVEEALAASEDWDGLVRHYKRFIPVSDDPEVRREYMEKAAQIELKVFNRLDSAIELYRQLLSQAPERTDYAFALAEALKKGNRFTELAWLYEQTVHKLKGDEHRSMLLEMADLYSTHLSNPEGALQALRQLIKANPEDHETFERARALCLEEKRFDTLLKILAERSKQVSEEERLSLKVEMARISAMEMGLLPPAKGYLEEVLRDKPGHEEGFGLYREILERQENWKELAGLMERQFESVQDEAVKVSLGMQLAEVYAFRLDDKVKATEVLEKVWELAPDNLRAGLQLAWLYSQMGRWDKAASMLSVIDDYKELLEDEDRGAYAWLSGLTYEALVERSKAVEAFRAALDMGYKVQEVKEKLASLLYMEENYDEARALMCELLEEGALGPERSREFRNLLADIDRKLGRREKSREYLEGLLAQDPGNRELLRKLVTVCREEGDRAAEVAYLRRLTQVETDPELRFPLLVALGDAARQTPELGEEAVTAYRKALEINPNSKGVLVSLAQYFMERGMFEDAVSSFRQAEELETSPERKAAFALTQGVLLVEQAGQPDEAVSHLTRALDYDPSKLEAFTLLEKLAVESNDWEQQRKLYENLLGRLGGEGDVNLRHRLHLNLGRILVEKFGDSKAAIRHFEEAVALRPDDSEARTLAVGVYLEENDSLDRALAELRRLLMATPRDVNLARMLRKAFAKMKRFDDAWYVVGILELLGAATPKEKAFYQRLSSSALKIKPKVIEIDMFRKWLAAAEEEWEISEILRVVFERMAPRLHLRSPKDLGLTKKNLLPEDKSPMLVKTADTVAKVLGIPKPAVYVREGSGWIVKEGCYPPALVVGADMFEARKGKELRFELAKTLSLFVPHHAVVGIVEKDALRMLLGNVLKLVVPAIPDPPGNPKQNQELRKELERSLPVVELGKIKELVTALRAREGELSVKRWLVGVEKTAARFGLLFANDIQVAATLVRTCPFQLSAAPREEIVDDLLRFAISEEFAKLREHLTISVI